MGFKFRKSIKLTPSIKLNISKSGVSVTLGKKGCKTNIKPGKNPKTTVSIPGTGISYEKKWKK